MQEAHTHSDADHDLETPSPHLRRRLVFALLIVLILLLLVFIPPLINVSRFKNRVDRNISAALGRPVHFDKLSLNLLPMPGFTLDNFVIDEDPAFGSEPILWASEVDVTLRISSLWSRHVEFSKIALADPNSVNLVHLSDGRWNIEGLLFQASHIQSSPTAQRFAGPAPRFPYISATGTRLNLKLDQEKMPFSLIDAEFALWQPEEHQWSVRLLAHPTRTDISPGDTGTVRIEATLGGAGTPATLAETALNLQGRWQDAQLGGLSQLATGSDAGLRGAISATFKILGTVAHNTITTDISLDNARRADFIPPSPLSLEAGCQSTASDTFHTFTSIECHWPPADSSNRSTLIVTANLADVRQPRSSTGQITLPALPADTFFNWLRVATPHPPTGLAGPGTLAGTIAWAPDPKTPRHEENWSGELEFSNGSLDIGAPNQKPIPLGDVILRSTPTSVTPAARSHHPAVTPAAPVPDGFDLEPVTLDLGGKDPATLTGHLDDAGYTLHLSGSAIPARLLALGDAIPQLGDGLKDCLQHLALIPPADPPQPAPTPRGGARGSAIQPGDSAETPSVQDQPTHIDLTATRAWGSAQTWCPPAPTQPAPHRSR